MPVNPFTRGMCPGRARPPHRGSFKTGHAKHGGRGTGTSSNAISPRARKAIAVAAKRITRGTGLSRRYWQRVMDNNPLILEALQKQGKFTLAGTPRFRSRKFSIKTFCKDLSAVAMRAIQTDQFVDRNLVECLTHLGIRDPTEFAKFLPLTLPQQSFLAARPHAEVVEPREAVNPGEDRPPLIPEWTPGYDPKLNAYTPVPVDPALTPQDAYHEICGAPFKPAPGWDWKFDSEARRYRAIALRPKTPIPEWTLRFDTKNVLGTPVPVDPRVTSDEAYHREYGSPLYPAPGWKWEFNSRTERLVPTIADEPSRHPEPRFALPKLRRLYRWHPDEGHYSLVREDDDDAGGYEDNLYEYDAERCFFKRRQPLRPTIKPEPVTRRRRFFVRLPDGTHAMTYSLDDIYEYDAKKKRFVRIAK
jgi:hypothetical protein